MTPAEMFEALPQEMKDEMRHRAQEIFHNNKDILRFIELESELSALNNQLCNTLGMMKLMLSKFDEKGTSVDKTKDNLEFFMKFRLLIAMPMQNLVDNITRFKQRHEKEASDNEGS